MNGKETGQFFEQVRLLAKDKLGIHLADHKNALIENRLIRLKSKIGFAGTLEELINTVQKGDFEKEFISAFTTNQTAFFREPAQFEHFKNEFLPSEFQNKNSLSVLSAGCSSGEEAYTIAMCFMASKQNGRSLKITALDIDEEKLKTAKEGVYAIPHANPFPQFASQNSYFYNHEEGGTKKLKIKDELKSIITFERHNLANPKETLKNSFFDAVFCRNTLIYFDKKKQEEILKKLLGSLKLGGFLYLGHSENPLSHIDRLQKKGHNIYIKKAVEEI